MNNLPLREQQVTSNEWQAGTGLLLSVTDPLNRRTTYTYDSMGDVTSLTRLAGTPDAVTISFTYEPNFNQVATVTDALGHAASFSYDSIGNLTTVADPLGHQTTFVYNGVGQPVSITNALSQTTQLSYDAGDLANITNPLGNSVVRFNDGAGRLLYVTDPLGNTTRYEYDVLNRLTRVTDPLQGATTFVYDLNSNLLSVTDARNNVTSFTYDNMDRVATRADPLLVVESYQYDAGGNLTKFTDRRGNVTAFSYDSLNRRTFAGFGETINGGTPTYESTINYTYDTGSRLTQAVDSLAGTSTLTYDNLDRTTSKANSQGTVSYAYDTANRRTSMTVTGQTAAAYAYDNANRLTGITQGTSSVSISYDLADRRSALTLPNGVAMEYTYDSDSKLTGITYKLGASVLGDLTYEFDGNRNRTKVGGSYARTGLPQAVSSATYNAANRLTQWGTANLTYDANGNLLSDGTNTYNWDARNQLGSMTGPGITASLLYDTFGNRTSKTVTGSTTAFLYDGANVIQELAGGAPTANLITGLALDEFLTRTESTGTRHFVTDAAGSTVALGDSSGALQTQYTYEPFGTVSVSGATTTNTFQFTRRENDGIGSYYYRARYYSPGFGRFISEDPVRLLGGINFYSYVSDNPVNRLDPSGLRDCCPGGGSGSYGICWGRCVQKGLGNAANYMLGLAIAGGMYAIGSLPVTLRGVTMPLGRAAGMVAGTWVGTTFLGGTFDAAVAGASVGILTSTAGVGAAGVAGAAGTGYAFGTMGYCAFQCSRNPCFEYPGGFTQ